MIEAISSWAEQIIIAIIIATIFEMIIPDCKNKKYVKTVIGLYILFTILSPIIKNFSNIDKSIAKSEYLNSMSEISTSYSQFNNLTNNNIQETYIISLKKDMQEKLNKKGYIVDTIKLEIEENNNTYGQINNLNISIYKKTKEENQINNNISVSKVEIENNKIKNETSKKDSFLTEKEIKEIKEYLSSEYGIEIDNIKIN